MYDSKTPGNIYLTHLDEFGYYSHDQKWKEWCAWVTPLRGLRTVKILLEYKNKKAVLLDLGCGLGFTLSIVGRFFPNSVGCDIAIQAVKASRKLLKKLNVKSKIIQYDGEHIPFADNHFDIVLCTEVIEHIANQDQVLQEINRVLKPKGILHITTANKLWPLEPHYKLWFLSYLPRTVAGWYIRLFNKGESYKGINLPTYNEFYNLVNKYFWVKDITLDLVRNYQRYNLKLERGWKVAMVGQLLKKLKPVKGIYLLKYLVYFIEYLIMQTSLGWLFICTPRKR